MTQKLIRILIINSKPAFHRNWQLTPFPNRQQAFSNQLRLLHENSSEAPFLNLNAGTANVEIDGIIMVGRGYLGCFIQRIWARASQLQRYGMLDGFKRQQISVIPKHSVHMNHFGIQNSTLGEYPCKGSEMCISKLEHGCDGNGLFHNAYQSFELNLVIIILKLIMSDPIVAELKNIKQGDKNLHQHLKQFISTLLLDRADLQDFEAYSAQHRIAGGATQCVFKVREAYSHLRQYQTKNRALLSKLNSGTEEEPQEPASIGYVPDLQQETRVFEQFGLGFGEDQTYRIFKSLSRFALKKNAKYIRLWGKIIGSEKDYYIAEGQAEGGEEAGELSPDTQPKGVGANKWNFYACTDLSGDWTQLPLITPTQLKIARRIKYIFTGDLNRTVLTNPLFPGKESHLLKCQLTRIQTTCSIVPRGSLVINAESNEVEVPEEYQWPEISTLAQKESWIYQNSSLLKNGRTTLLKPEGLEPEEEQKWVKAQSQLDPSQPKLKNIVLDSEKWSIKGVGIEEVYKTIGKNSKAVSKGVVGIKNLVWPGWLTVAYGAKASSIYIGYGHKYKQNYYPFDPEPVLQERDDSKEFVVVQ